MWQAIARNRLRSRFLLGALFVLLAALGTTAGWFLDAQWGWAWGLVVAGFVWAGQLALALGAGDHVVLAAMGARRVNHSDAPRLVNIVEEMSIAAGLARPPDIFVIDHESPNAFAVGMTPDRASVAVTAGLLRRLGRDQLQGVIAHEVGHIVNRDTQFLTLAAVSLGAIVLVSDLFFRSLMLRGLGRRRTQARENPQLALVMGAVALALAILAPLIARLLYLACNREREFLADATAARLTRYPEGLAAALEAIEASSALFVRTVNRAVAPMCIVNPLASGSGPLSTHPPTAVRVRILRGMAGGAGYADYARSAWRELGRAGEGFLVGLREIEKGSAIAARGPLDEATAAAEFTALSREAGTLLDRAAEFVAVPCSCGTVLKVPPDFRQRSLACPSCGRVHDLSDVQRTPLAAAPREPLSYTRQSTGKWETLRCRCGRKLQLSPRFRAPSIRCTNCGTIIEINSKTGHTA